MSDKFTDLLDKYNDLKSQETFYKNDFYSGVDYRIFRYELLKSKIELNEFFEKFKND